MSKTKKLVPKRRFKKFIITKEWQQVKLGDVSEIIGGGTPSTNIPAFWSGDIDWYSPTEIGNKIYVSQSEKKITQLGLSKSSAKILPIGTILYTSRAGIGNTAILAKEATTNQGFQSIVPKQDKLHSYFIYSRTKELKRYGEAKGGGSTFKEISGKQLAQMPIFLPVLNEQIQIGEFFKKLDTLIQTQQKKLEKTKTLKSAYLAEMFSCDGELKPKIRFKEFRENWQLLTLGELKDVRDGTHDSPTYHKQGFPLVTSKNLTDYGLDINEVSLISKTDFEKINKRSKVDRGDILFGMIGTIGNPVLVERDDFAIKNVALIKKGGNILNIFLIQLLKSQIFEKYVNSKNVGNTQKFLALSQIREFNLVTPFIKEQTKIGNFFKLLDKKIALEQRKLEKLNNIKQAYLNEMFV